MNLYPIFMTNHCKMLDVLFHEKEEDRSYIEEKYGIPIGYETENGIISKKEIDKYPLEMRNPDYIVKNNPISASYIKKPFGAKLTDFIMQDFISSLNFDMRQVYEAKVSYIIKKKCRTKIWHIGLFAGAEIILFPSYLKEMADNLGCNLYIYLIETTCITVIPEKAILSDEGVFNFHAALSLTKDKDDPKHFYDGIFYFNRETRELQLLYHFEKDFDNWGDEESPE